MNFRPQRNNRRPAPLLDMTPLIDVVFLLLIFFLITTTFIKRRETIVSVNLPSGSAEEVPQDDQERLTVFVDSDGGFTLRLQDTDAAIPVDREALRSELETLYETNPNLPIFLRGDRAVSYGAIMDIWLLSREIGFTRVNAVVRRHDEPENAP